VTFQTIVLPISLLILGSASVLFSQAVTSSILGTVVDPAGGVVPGVEVRLTNQGTAAVNTAKADSSGLFRIANIFAGTYSVTVQAKGFKSLTVTSIEIGASETRDLGHLTLTLGNITESISVTGEVAAIETASSDRSPLVDASEFNTVAIKGHEGINL